jgi:hypothetical protein
VIVCLRALRPHQWVKNVLLFVPLALAHRVSDAGLLAGRGQMQDDPIIFTFKDRASYITGFIILAVIIGAV